MLPALQDHPDAHLVFQRVGLLRGPVLDKLDADHEPFLPYLSHVIECLEPPELFREKRDLRPEPGDGLFFFEEVDVRDCRRAGQGIARIGVAVKEGPQFPVLAEEPPVDIFRRQRRCQGKVAAGDALGHGHDVRDHLLLLAGEHRSRPPEPCGDFIGYHENIVFCAELPDPFEVSRRVGEHARGALDQGLDDEGRCFMAVRGDDLFRLFCAGQGAAGTGFAQATAVAGGGVDLDGMKEQGFVKLMKEFDAADAHRPEGIAVIGFPEGDEACFRLIGRAFLLPILEGDLEGDLDCRRTAV